jgi:spore maturation protein CgeB
MKVMYVGQCEEGSTSRMRFEILTTLLNSKLELINISEVLSSSNKIVRSVGWRYKIGPLIWRISKLINEHLEKKENYDLIWIDKGVFIPIEVMKKLREKTIKLVHFTPDPAFFYHKSKLFYNSISLYDFCITTKTYEIDLYKKFGAKNVLYCTQGYDERIHKPLHKFEDKKYEVCFIGHYERIRETILQNLLNSNIQVVLAGIKWKEFVSLNKNRGNLIYLGENLAGIEYVETISNSYISLGLISNWVPEKHTTRTFEIPACGTLLITPKNEEIKNFYNEKDVIYFEDNFEIVQKVRELLNDKSRLQEISNNGTIRVNEGNFSYQKQLKSILKSIQQT